MLGGFSSAATSSPAYGSPQRLQSQRQQLQAAHEAELARVRAAISR